MALNNFSNLKQTIERFSHRSDVSDVIDDFVSLAENKIDKGLKLRNNELRVRASAPTADRFLELPTRFLEMRRLSLINSSVTKDIKYRAPEALRIADTSGEPKYFTITSQIEFDRTPSSAFTIEMAYYARISPLTTSNTTNDVLTDYPDLYLYGALAELHRWARDEEQAEYCQSVFEKELVKANFQENRGRYGPAPTAAKEGWTP